MSVEQDKRGAAVKFPPPLIFLSLLAVGMALDSVWPLVIDNRWLSYFGASLALLGIVLVVLLKQSFQRAKTNIEPWKPTTTIISSGFYAYSRNPIYLSFCFIVLGLGLYWNSIWMAISFLPAALLTYYLAIRKEEYYLQKKFGQQYLDYKRRVRRWL